jgi:mannose-6-phosphate isomerase
VLYSLTFHPIFKERVWGGRKLEELFNKPLPPGAPVGESWEITDRPGDVSVIANGPLAGKDLHWLVEHHRKELLGATSLHADRFPLLVKILDAREKLSLQVHPPPDVAAKLGAEPKTELWYIIDTDPQANLYVGLKRGVTKSEFEQRIKAGTVADCVHQFPVQPGDAMFLPSGRLHAIGAGLVLFEIQQNSDTTYRVFDWNRTGLDGKPRALHVRESLASIDFDDYEPALVERGNGSSNDIKTRSLAEDRLFSVKLLEAETQKAFRLPIGKLSIIGVTRGNVTIQDKIGSLHLRKGQFSLIPAEVSAEVSIDARTSLMLVRPGT